MRLAAHRKERRRRLIVLLSIFVTTFFALMFAARPVYHRVKAWRARSLASQAERFITEKKWEEAGLKARVAFQLKSDEPSALRAAARIESLSGQPTRAIAFWKPLLESKGATVADRRNFIEDVLRAGGIDQASLEIQKLRSEEPENPATLRLSAKVFAAQGQFDASIEAAQRAMNAEPKNLENKFLVASLLIDSKKAEQRDDGWKQLGEIAQDKSKVGLQALALIAMRRDLPYDLIEPTIHLLKTHPEAEELHQVVALDLEIRSHPSRREELLDATVKSRKNASPKSLQAFGSWLNNKNEFRRTLVLLPQETALKRRDLFLVYIDALGGLKRWKDVQELLKSKNVPLDETYTQVFLARAAEELGDPTEARLHWKYAQVAATRNTENLWFLASYAEKYGEIDVAEHAYRSLTSNVSTSRPAYLALIRLTEKRKQTQALLEIMREMLKQWPNDPAIQNDAAYLSLLVGADMSQALQIAQYLVNTFPNRVTHRTTLALGYLRSNDPTAAAKAYDGTNVAWETQAPNVRAVRAAVLSANGEKGNASALAGSIPLAALRREEAALIAPLKR